MNPPQIKTDSNWRLAAIALGILVVDQLTKLVVLQHLDLAEEFPVLPGFFKLVHWGNTGAAWSMFKDNNALLAGVALAALLVLVLSRHHFDVHRPSGQIALGLILGGITGNLADRILRKHVVDFLYFYVIRRDGLEAGFPAFNVADSSIFVGVGLLFLLSWQNDDSAARRAKSSEAPQDTTPSV